MNEVEEHNLGEQVRELERKVDKGFADLRSWMERLLLGDLDNPDNQGGFLGRLRKREEVATDHELRIVELEAWRKEQEVVVVKRKDYEKLEAKVADNTTFRLRIIWMVTGAALAGGVGGGGIVAIVARIIGG